MSRIENYESFLREQYKQTPDVCKEIYGDFETFLSKSVSMGLYKEWIENIKDKTLTKEEMEMVAETMHDVANVKVTDIVSKLMLISHQQNVCMPGVLGCLTNKYWEDFFSARNA